MLLTCPHCETIFRVETTDIKTGGRQVRCSVCSHIWNAKRGGANVITEDADLIQHLKSWQSSVFLIVIAIAIAATMTVNRAPISAKFPSLIPLYESIGLVITPDLTAVEIGRLSATRKRDTVRVFGRSDQYHIMAYSFTVVIGHSDRPVWPCFSRKNHQSRDGYYCWWHCLGFHNPSDTRRPNC